MVNFRKITLFLSRNKSNHIGSIQSKIRLLEMCQKLRKTLRRESRGSTPFSRSSEVFYGKVHVLNLSTVCRKFRTSLTSQQV